VRLFNNQEHGRVWVRLAFEWCASTRTELQRSQFSDSGWVIWQVSLSRRPDMEEWQAQTGSIETGSGVAAACRSEKAVRLHCAHSIHRRPIITELLRTRSSGGLLGLPPNSFLVSCPTNDPANARTLIDRHARFMRSSDRSLSEMQVTNGILKRVLDEIWKS